MHPAPAGAAPSPCAAARRRPPRRSRAAPRQWPVATRDPGPTATAMPARNADGRAQLPDPT
eukprot:10517205-Lingulodinium_polyedra.AAC.1